MFAISRITEERLAQRVCASFNVDKKGAFAYSATKDGVVLATAAFITESGGCVVLRGVDTGRRQDIDLVDGIARAAFSTQLRAGAKTARLDEALSPELRLALSKLGYAAEGVFDLATFFTQKRCAGDTNKGTRRHEK